MSQAKRIDTSPTYPEVVSASWGPTVRFALSLTLDQSTAEDLAQEAMIRLYRNWHRVDSGRSLQPYLRQTVVRLHLNLLRGRARQDRVARRISKERTSEPTSVDAPSLPGWLETAWNTISSNQRTAVAMVHIWGYSIAEASELMGCRPNTVKTHLSRGLQSLRAASSLTPTQNGRSSERYS